MPRLHYVKKARKDNPVAKKGEDYYWWQFAFRGKSFSKTPPKQSQLTQSEFLGQMYDISDSISDLVADESLADEVSSIIDDITTLGEEQQEKLDNMPDSLQDAPSGEILQSRVESCETWVSELENVELEIEVSEELVLDECDTDKPERADYETNEEYCVDIDDYHEKLDDTRRDLEDSMLQEILEDVQACEYDGE